MKTELRIWMCLYVYNVCSVVTNAKTYLLLTL